MTQEPRTRVRVLDLTVAQVEQLERAVGIPMTRWQAPGASSAAILRAVLAMVDGVDPATLSDLTMRQLLERVSLDGPGDAAPEA